MADPSKIMQVGLGFWSSQALLVAVKLGLFTELAGGPLDAKDIQARLGLHDRAVYDFLDALVALGFLTRTGFLETAAYANAEDADLFLDRNKPSYIGGILEMAGARLYGAWGRLETGLKTGQPQNEARLTGKPIFEAIYSNEEHLRSFLAAMGGIQMGNFVALSQQFDFSKHQTHCDIGGAGGLLATQVARHHPHMQCTSYDLPEVGPVARENIEAAGLADRVAVAEGDMFAEAFPNADVITMGNILHDWGLDEKKHLIQKAHDALPEGGALVIIESIIDDQREENSFGLLMSLNMLIETDGGFDYSAADFQGWASEAGFKRFEVMPLTGPSSAVIAYK